MAILQHYVLLVLLGVQIVKCDVEFSITAEEIYEGESLKVRVRDSNGADLDPSKVSSVQTSKDILSIKESLTSEASSIDYTVTGLRLG